MALKLTVESLDGLDDGVKSLYKEDNGKFRLDLDGYEDTTGLKAQRDALLNEKKDAQRKAKEAEESAKLAAEEAARKSGDVSALEKSWQEKLATTESNYKTQAEALTKQIHGLTVGQTATKLAAELAISGSADVLLPHIQSRLTVEIKDGVPSVRVLDLQGKPTAMTVDELKQEFISNKAFAPLIAASKATGGGASAGGGGGAAKTMKRDQFEAMNPAQKMDFIKSGGKLI
jgi:multidrug efflux pump subunit AcrA (membrane-fusion protein)